MAHKSKRLDQLGDNPRVGMALKHVYTDCRAIVVDWDGPDVPLVVMLKRKMLEPGRLPHKPKHYRVVRLTQKLSDWSVLSRGHDITLW